MSIDWVEFLAEAIRMATPLIFAALAALITRQAGMFNMATTAETCGWAFSARCWWAW